MKVVKNCKEQSDWTSVCQLDQLMENYGQCVQLNQEQVAIFRVSGIEKICAIDNFDPFSGANVLSRGIVGDIKGVPVVASPVYKQHFDLLTGQCLEDETVKLATYPVRVLDGVVQLSTK
ncbi:MAG: nitrite reductase (NAD(P)H) small subunit [SAR86 cluster bacterium]|uniref:Nitrite reductase (NAD(P)H) small subunit n=1 Tax=SAR86 cluster bacterium TaxID=2030880 RepID=A0A2A4XE84_9GAMM|nr:MAG: nitrite reductase (NAD(P)H) small subunit [SAR86 cluster bacterium]